MLNFEYSIKLNDEGRPYIHIPDTYIDKSEDKFMALELSRYVFNSLLLLRSSDLPPDQLKALESTYETLETISDELAILLRGQMEMLGEAEIIMYKEYHVAVKNKKELFDLEYDNIIYNGRIFKRMIGLRVIIQEDMDVFELVDGIDNEHWKKL